MKYAFLAPLGAMDANRGIGDIWVTLGPKGPALQGDEPEASQPLADDHTLLIKLIKFNITFVIFLLLETWYLYYVFFCLKLLYNL